MRSACGGAIARLDVESPKGIVRPTISLGVAVLRQSHQPGFHCSDSSRRCCAVPRQTWRPEPGRVRHGHRSTGPSRWSCTMKLHTCGALSLLPMIALIRGVSNHWDRSKPPDSRGQVDSCLRVRVPSPHSLRPLPSVTRPYIRTLRLPLKRTAPTWAFRTPRRGAATLACRLGASRGRTRYVQCRLSERRNLFHCPSRQSAGVHDRTTGD
jgi:hypothetical protein